MGFGILTRCSFREMLHKVEGRMWVALFRCCGCGRGLFSRSFDLFVGMEVIEAYVLEAGSFFMYYVLV